MNFSDKDLKQIEQKGLSAKKVKKQMELFENGLPFSNLVSAAILKNGITKLSEKQEANYIDLFEQKKNAISILKFVPASGAATRMFKFLFTFLDDYEPKEESINSYINSKKDSDLSLFFIGLEKFPFYHIVLDQLKEENPNFNQLPINTQLLTFVRAMLDKNQLDYGNYPKGLLPFHEYKNQVISTAFEEHLFESALYSSEGKPTQLHFTISEEHELKFDEEFKRIEDKVEHKTGSKFDISFSYQKKSTDTIAVTPKNKPFRNDDGSLLFRPSGHGALIENLNDLRADIIFVKNIDNVVVYKYKNEVVKYKKILAGVLLEVQESAFEYLRVLDAKALSKLSAEAAEEKIQEIRVFLETKMSVKVSSEFEKYKTRFQVEYLAEKLNRPIRVCGMVKNEGEPGGGPFWVKDENGSVSLQIVESAQINAKNKIQKKILKAATHFNPVDLVCGIMDYKGEKFKLKKYVDHKTAFITKKTTAGKDLKALELPGLWNGSMANWNTIFVEVPLITFNPVKTVNDLLKTTHQIK
ncbi:DUF4301 family protein [Subsaximicrobium wynnwilliamsii]|uniref:DUF4301 family protein n=1 Tax=Subsaximicrobium wynnwilliamsii TaxID=291179 RepID=A0A5C6ZGZ8_9FLAO|nr:DUF4301 family protein [Subsaximicrobium wynnwilliamsii]TXD83695.1 DUF4301 family protein [Subsaximicrobium wynnwilliamsii]TXD89421.1 DUF4301 family protein [Subsaximicrobium wynnwilliamsii]TXE03532.1 DUF4301 family protein [Subsaximicrobium wynnwilliamsii]